MHFFHFYFARHQHGLPLTSFWLYELSVWLHTLALSLVWVFIPILLLKSGFIITDVLLYYLIYNALDVPLNFVAKSLVRHIGARWVIVAAISLVVVFFTLFSSLENANWSTLILMALCVALYDTLYWVSHIYFFISSDRSTLRTSRTTGIMYAVRDFAGMLGPAAGAIILIFFNKNVAFTATITLLILSLLPLLLLRGMATKPHAPSLSVKKFFSSGGGRPFVLTALYAVHDSAENTLFPLFIFVTFGTLESVAYVPIIFSFAAIVLSVTLGRIKPKRRNLAITAGALILVALWLGRLYLDGATFLYFSIFVAGLFAHFILVPLDSDIFEHARRVGDPLTASTYRNTTYMSMNVIFYGILFLLLNVFDASFILAGASLLGLATLNLLYFVYRHN